MALPALELSKAKAPDAWAGAFLSAVAKCAKLAASASIAAEPEQRVTDGVKDLRLRKVLTPANVY